MKNSYFTRDSPNTNIKSSSRYVNVYIFPDYVQAVGVSYDRHWKTKAELEREIAELKSKPYSSEEYEMKLSELNQQLEERKQKQKPHTQKSKGKSRTYIKNSMQRSQQQLTSYLYGNFDVPFALMATLTYKYKVYDMKITTQNFSEFRRKFKKAFPNAVWLAVYEFHEDGSTHIHFIYKNARGATQEVLTEMWGHGMAYITQFQPEKIPYFCKKERLNLYPSGTKLYT